MFDRILIFLLIGCAAVFLRLTMHESQKYEAEITSIASTISGTNNTTTNTQKTNTDTNNTTTNTDTFPAILTLDQQDQIINRAQSNNITAADTRTTFKPNDHLTRAQFAKMIVTFAAAENKLDTTKRDSDCLFFDFQDAGDLSLYVYDVCNNGLMGGVQGYFYPNNTISQAEVIVTLVRYKAGKKLDESQAPRFQAYLDYAQDNDYVTSTITEPYILNDKATRAFALQLLHTASKS